MFYKCNKTDITFKVILNITFTWKKLKKKINFFQKKVKYKVIKKNNYFF